MCILIYSEENIHLDMSRIDKILNEFVLVALEGRV